ncbi:MAG: CotH kinase family protein [Crocinitomicaceae bacterium]|nr:CotH kinase family protein [Flavobacteriales bacterium]NQZ35960.1 CotH kinase family protein [Crocinitomicaceae bacterium]
MRKRYILPRAIACMATTSVRPVQRVIFLLALIFTPIFSYSQVDHWETAVYETDTWRYLIPSNTVSGTWNTIGFNDASWSTGQGGFGYGDGDDNTTFSATVSCYQRKTFTITDLAAIDQAIFNIDYDDAFVAYLNGVEITRDNISSAGQPAWNQTSDGLHEAQMYQGGYPLQFVISSSFLASNLVSGTNVLCVQTHNQSNSSSDMSSRVFLSLGINNTSNDYGPTPPWFVPPFVFNSSDLPIVVINTAGGATIPNEPKIDATMGIIYNGVGVTNSLSDPFNEFDGVIGIEIRGSSSSGFPKKQWGLETRDPSGNKIDVSIFDMAYDNDWILQAPYSDKSLMRNVLTYKMGWDTDRYAPRTKFCEVILNGEYQGVYVFMEKIKRKDGKVGINDVEPQDVSDNELTGDYIFKVDKLTSGGQVAWTSPYPTYPFGAETIDIQLHDPELDSLVPVQLAYLENTVTAFETALSSSNFADPVLGYDPYIDRQSFIDFILVNEFGKNVDGYRISTYLHKRRLSEGGKIVAGPLWDFNLAFGNANYCQGGDTDGWEIYFNVYCGGGLSNPFWFERLLQDSNFADEMNCRWRDLRAGKWHTDSLMDYIDEQAAILEQSQVRNYQKWQVLGMYLWPNNFVGNTYAEEIAYLKTWVTDRANWMDANMFGSCSNWSVDEIEGAQVRVFPNPATDHVLFEFTELVADGTLELFDHSGKRVHSISFQNNYQVEIDLTQFSSGVYTYRILESTYQPITGKLIIQ